MKAISLWQPYASLWASGLKTHETRSWRTSHRGLLAVHAGKKEIDDADEWLDQQGFDWLTPLVRGAIVGVVHLSNCRYTGRSLHEGWVLRLDGFEKQVGDFSLNRFGWEASYAELLPEPIPMSGKQGIFDLPDDIASAVRRQLSARAKGGGL